MQNRKETFPLFSVIIPVYNVQEYLRQCVKSVQIQELDDKVEIILVDDGSTDTSGTICDELAKGDERVTVIHQKNKGLPGARNTGIKAARGKWLIFLDSDDFWQEGFLQKLYSKMKENPGCNLYIGRFLSMDTEGTIKIPAELEDFIEGKVKKGSLKDRFLWYNNMVQVSAWKMAVEASWLNETGLTFAEDIKYAEDVVWSMQIFQLDPPIYYVDLPFVIYRTGRQGSITTGIAPPFKNFEARIAAWKYFIDGGKYKGDDEDNAFAQSFMANKVVGEFQSQIKHSKKASLQAKKTIELMMENMEATKCIRKQDISFKRYLAAKIVSIFGAKAMAKLVRLVKDVKKQEKQNEKKNDKLARGQYGAN